MLLFFARKIYIIKQMKKPKAWLNWETMLRKHCLWRQMFPSLAAGETYVAETNFATRKQKMFLPEVKNIFASRTQMLLSKHMFPSLATIKTMFTRSQCFFFYFFLFFFYFTITYNTYITRNITYTSIPINYYYQYTNYTSYYT